MNDVSVGFYLIYGAIKLAVAIAIGVWKGRLFGSIVWATFLGPIGWVIVALGPNMTVKKAVDCPHCGGVLPVNQAECKHCANKVLWIQGKARKPSRVAA